MSTKLEIFLTLLSDNVWHNVDETAKTLRIPRDKFQETITFLTEAELIQRNPATNQIKLNQNRKTLLLYPKETQAQPETTALGTIIIPPQKTLIVQFTRISNLTDVDLELEIRIDEEIREIAINRIK